MSTPAKTQNGTAENLNEKPPWEMFSDSSELISFSVNYGS